MIVKNSLLKNVVLFFQYFLLLFWCAYYFLKYIQKGKRIISSINCVNREGHWTLTVIIIITIKLYTGGYLNDDRISFCLRSI